MVTQAKEQIQKAKELLEVIETRRELEKKEKELKEHFKLFMGDEMALTAGDVLINRKEESRRDFDKKRLLEEEGQEFVDRYTKTTTYEKFNCQKI